MPNSKPQELFDSLKRKSVSDMYIFHGEEAYLCEEALRALKAAVGADELNTEVFYGNDADINQVLISRQTMPFMSGKRLIIVKDAQKIRSHDLEKLNEAIKSTIDTSCIVLIWNERPKPAVRNSSLFKTARKHATIVEFWTPFEKDLPSLILRYVKKHGKTISYDASKFLAGECGSNLMDLSNEIEKLALFIGKGKEIGLDDVKLLSGHTKQASLNELAGSIEAKSMKRAVRIIEELIDEGEPSPRILYTIGRVARKLLTAKYLKEESFLNDSDISKQIKLKNYFDRNFFYYLSRHSLKGLENSIISLREADISMKTGRLPEKAALEELVYKMLG